MIKFTNGIPAKTTRGTKERVNINVLRYKGSTDKVSPKR